MEATFEVPEFPSPQLKTVLHYLDLVKTLNIEEIDKLFIDDFVQSTRPLTLHVPSRTKEEDLAFLKGLSETLQGRHLEVIHLISVFFFFSACLVLYLTYGAFGDRSPSMTLRSLIMERPGFMYVDTFTSHDVVYRTLTGSLHP
jgi:hypothetical protein